MKVTMWKCTVCGRVTKGRLEDHGPFRGKVRYPRRHLPEGIPCPGIYQPAVAVETEVHQLSYYLKKIYAA